MNVERPERTMRSTKSPKGSGKLECCLKKYFLFTLSFLKFKLFIKNNKSSLKFFLIDHNKNRNNKIKNRLFVSRALNVGGSANDGSYAGLGYCNTNNAASNVNTNIGSRKCLKIKWDKDLSSC
jgi:hypothetical protein